MKEVERIIRVDHAGERGAIGIYSAQLLVARILYKDLVMVLEEMLSHEREHFGTFNRLLKVRGIRHCYGLTIWALGGLDSWHYYSPFRPKCYLGVYKFNRNYSVASPAVAVGVLGAA
jgi:hypothetical protein